MSVSDPDTVPEASRDVQLQSSLLEKYLALPLPLTPHTTLHIRITALETSNMIFLTTTDFSTSSSSSALGSFVYAMPNRLNPADVLSTALFPVPGSLDLATRVAKILARRSGKPTYVGCSVSFPGATVEEEIEAVKVAIEAIMGELGPQRTQVTVNGT